jgi:hypothetical protein
LQIVWVKEQSLIALVWLDVVAVSRLGDILDSKAETTQRFSSKLNGTHALPTRSLV